MEDQEVYQIARKRVEEKFGFYVHLSVYIAVNIFLIIINLSTSTQYLWFKWPLMGWGIGLFFHALKVFVSVLLKLSGATAYPDEDSILLEAPQTFSSIEDYEKSILS